MTVGMLYANKVNIYRDLKSTRAFTGGLCGKGDFGSHLGGGGSLSSRGNIIGSRGFGGKGSFRSSSGGIGDRHTLSLDAAAANWITQLDEHLTVYRNITGEEIRWNKSGHGGCEGAGGACFAQCEEGGQVGGGIETSGAEDGGRGEGGFSVCGRGLDGGDGCGRRAGTAGTGADADGEGDDAGDEVGEDHCERVW
ncbi:hypothetical protein ACHAPQ_009869 [Fusarium lateritium]